MVKTVLCYFQLVVETLVEVGLGKKNYHSSWGSCNKRFYEPFLAETVLAEQHRFLTNSFPVCRECKVELISQVLGGVLCNIQNERAQN